MFANCSPRLLSILILLLFCESTRANLLDPESGRPIVRDFRPTEYLGHPQIFSVAQGADGFIYMANVQGIVQYDGIRWTHHPAPLTFTYRVTVTPDGKIWTSSFDEIGYFEPDAHSSKLIYHSLRDRLPPDARRIGRGGDNIYYKGAVYYVIGAGLVRFDAGELKLWPSAPDSPKGDLNIVDDQLYWVRNGKELTRINGDALEIVARDDALLSGHDVQGVGRKNDSPFWIIGERGVFEIDSDSQTFRRVPGALDTWVSDTRVNDAINLGDGSIAVATSLKGLLISSLDGKIVRKIDRESGLADNAVLSLFIDRDQGLWAGLNSGAARLNYRSAVTVFDSTNGPTPGTIDGWFRHNNRVYAGAFDGLYRLEPPDPVSGVGARFTRIVDDLTNVFAFASIEGDLIFSSSEGLHRLHADGSHSLFIELAHNLPKLMFPSRTNPDRYYLSGQDGLSVLEKVDSTWTVTAEFLQTGQAFTALEEENGDVWLGSYNTGFWRIPDAANITDWTGVEAENYNRSHGLPQAMTWTTVTPGSAGPIFFTDAGSMKFDRATKQFEPDDRYPIEGRHDHSMSPSIMTPDGATWTSVFRENMMAAVYSLGRFVRQPDGSLLWQTASTEALDEIGFGGVAVFQVDETGTEPALWARGYNNHIRIRLNDLAAEATPWPIAIRGLRRGDDPIPFSTANDKVATLNIPFSRDPLTFDFASPRFDNAGELRFQTRLLGFSDRWSSPQSIPQVSFTNLEGGPFVLEVRAIDPAGTQSLTSRITFTVTPPWFRTASAYVAYVAFAFALIALAVRWRLNRFRREQLRLETIVSERTAQLAIAKNEAEDANQAKSTFLANMSHELRTPLNGVLGYAQIMLRDRQLPPANREQVRVVASSGEHLLKMINEVLDFSKIEAGKIELRPAPFSLPSLLQDIEVALAPRAAAKHLTFKIESTADLPSLCIGDALKLRQVIDNLLSNAIKFTAEGSVTLSVQRHASENSTFDFQVTDTGVGLSPRDLERLFTPFNQAVDARPPEPGTGLGLSISQRLVELMDGKITVTSQPRRGSIFKFSLRLEELAAEAGAIDDAELLPVEGYEGPVRSLLIVDDVAVNRELLRDLLTPLGFVCTIVANAEGALSFLARESVACVILDLRMPGVDGLELARLIRASDRPQPKIVLTSASVLSFDTQIAFDAGCDDFLPKPFQEKDLLTRLARLMRLQWIYAQEAIAPPGPSFPPFVAPTDADWVQTLTPFAQRGDIRGLRQQLDICAKSGAADQMTVKELQSLAASFQMDRIRKRLETLVSQ